MVIEKSFIAECNSLTTAIVDLIGSYFVFDIVYPQSLYAVLIFIQHIVLGIIDKQRCHKVSMCYIAYHLTEKLVRDLCIIIMDIDNYWRPPCIMLL